MLESVTCYRAPTTVVDVEAVADWLESTVECPVTVRDRFLECHHHEGLAEVFAKARVHAPTDRRTGNKMLGTIRYEERALKTPERAGGVLYDGQALERALNEALPASERGLESAHLIFLDRAIGTWGDHDGRWHKRISVLGQPAIISVPGLYEAPAKPESYYKAKGAQTMQSGKAPPREVLEAAIDDDFLREDDPRTTEAIKGAALSAVHYLETGEAFCDDRRCRLYNAHYQDQLLRAQLEAPEFCERHRERYGER